MRILLAFSGGLDTSWLAARFAAEGHEVTTLHVDCGGLDAAGHRALREQALALGAHRHRTVDARQELWDRVLRWLLAGNVLRGGAYPLRAAAEPGVQPARLARAGARGGSRAPAPGCPAASPHRKTRRPRKRSSISGSASFNQPRTWVRQASSSQSLRPKPTTFRPSGRCPAASR